LLSLEDALIRYAAELESAEAFLNTMDEIDLQPYPPEAAWTAVAADYLSHPLCFIDLDEVRDLALSKRPKLIIAGGTAYSRAIDFAGFRAIADEVGAYLMVDMAHFAGLIAADLYPNPFPHADVVTTTTYKSLRGARGGLVLWNDEGLSKKVNSGIFPGVQGSVMLHAVAGKAACLGEALRPEFKVYNRTVLKTFRYWQAPSVIGEFALSRAGLTPV
jgi:glycine/serine hydroxymethyltransferase